MRRERGRRRYRHMPRTRGRDAPRPRPPVPTGPRGCDPKTHPSHHTLPTTRHIEALLALISARRRAPEPLVTGAASCRHRAMPPGRHPVDTLGYRDGYFTDQPRHRRHDRQLRRTDPLCGDELPKHARKSRPAGLNVQQQSDLPPRKAPAGKDSGKLADDLHHRPADHHRKTRLIVAESLVYRAFVSGKPWPSKTKQRYSHLHGACDPLRDVLGACV